MVRTIRRETTTAAAGQIRRADPATSWLHEIRIVHGPADLFGRFFLMSDYLLRKAGLNLAFATFEELFAINESNRDTWKPIVPTFNFQNGLLDDSCAFALVARNAAGMAVSAQATRGFDWRQSCFQTEGESLRLFFAEPSKMATRGEMCTITAPSARTLSGRVAFSGGAWFHPSMRGKGLFSVLARVARSYAYTRWQTDLAMAVMSNGLIGREFWRQNGYQHAEAGFALRNFELGDYDGGAVWITTEELIDDIAWFMAQRTDSASSHGGATQDQRPIASQN